MDTNTNSEMSHCVDVILLLTAVNRTAELFEEHLIYVALFTSACPLTSGVCARHRSADRVETDKYHKAV